MTSDKPRTVLFPINQDEQAVQAKADYLLAQDVFEKIADLLKRGLDKVDNLKDVDDLDKHRAHEAILLQGPRGSGKSAVLVNLSLYLEERRPTIWRDLLILKPIDPTLLEDGEDMFLDVFIAALVRDKQIKAKLDLGGSDAEAFYDQLCKVGSAQESSQTQKEKYGMDRVRALMGGSGIAEQVHKLFQSALKLTCKKLIVLPIDDVDTALQHAYDKIEIVRKYLVSPVAIPLISGDLALYNDVIWRDFHGRLLTDSKAEKKAAKDRAKELSIAYQRKILPLPRRIEVPKLDTYLNESTVMLVGEKDKHLLSFQEFRSWLEAVLNERVNGVENSHLTLPIATVREFAQLISKLGLLLFEPLAALVTAMADKSEIGMRRSLIMTADVAKLISKFEGNIAAVRLNPTIAGRTPANVNAYENLKTAILALTPMNRQVPYANFLLEWHNALLDYFYHHIDGGRIYLVMAANVYFKKCASDPVFKSASIFDTDLFMPKNHSKYRQFSQQTTIQDEWAKHIEKQITSSVMKYMPQTSILPYPRPELGREINGAGTAFKLDSCTNEEHIKNAENAELVRRLMVHYNFYNSAMPQSLVFTGRIFELVITSLIRDTTVDDVLGLMNRAPFYSAPALVSTKTFYSNADETENRATDSDRLWGDTLSALVKNINDWRAENNNSLSSQPNSWLIYNVTNKFFNQANYFNQTNPTINPQLSDVFATALNSFNAIWAIFGSFEKGQVFGLYDYVARMNVENNPATFRKSKLYEHNIAPFLFPPEPDDSPSTANQPTCFDFRTGAYTYLLTTHPVRILLASVFTKWNATYKTLII